MKKRSWRRMDGENKIREGKMEKRRWRREDEENKIRVEKGR